MSYRVISIGTLAAHPLWDERREVRTGHATCTLVTMGDTRILVDPSLPGPVVEARLAERSGLTAERITHVFVTTFSLEHYRGLARFDEAVWLVHGPERDAAGAALDDALARAREIDDRAVIDAVEWQRNLLGRCRVADDRIVPGVDLFPLPGVSPGTCGLLLPLPTATVLVCGDAIPTIEHLEQGKVLPTCHDVESAMDSFREAIEIADIFVLGRDNVTYNPLRRA